MARSLAFVVLGLLLIAPVSVGAADSALVKALRNFRNEEGKAWRVSLDRYGRLSALSGGRTISHSGPLSQAARRFVSENGRLFGVHAQHTEVFEQGTQPAANDHDVVRLGVRYRSLEVVGASIEIEFDEERRIVGARATNPPVHLVATEPRLSADRIREIVERSTRAELKGKPRLAIHPSAGGRLVYVVTLETPGRDGADPVVAIWSLDANSGTRVR